MNTKERIEAAELALLPLFEGGQRPILRPLPRHPAGAA